MSTNDPMPEEELDAIRERVDAVGPIQPARYGTAPYEVYDSAEYENGEMGDYVTHGSPREVDAEFITHAYTDVPALLAEVERLRALIKDRAIVWEDAYAWGWFNAWAKEWGKNRHDIGPLDKLRSQRTNPYRKQEEA